MQPPAATPQTTSGDGVWLGATPTAAQLEAMPLDRFHHAIDQLDAQTVPESYWRKVVERRRGEAWEIR